MFKNSFSKLCHRNVRTLLEGRFPAKCALDKAYVSTGSLRYAGSRPHARKAALIQANVRVKRMQDKGTYPTIRRSQLVEWNQQAELYAFGRRLNESFDESLLTEALVEASHVLEEEKRLEDVGLTDSVKLTSNRELAETGMALIKDFSAKFLRAVWPLLPEEGIQAAVEYLTSTQVLAQVGSEIGLKDLICSAEYPPSEEAHGRCFTAVIGALNASSGIERTQKFILDFLISRLEGKDVWDFWEVHDPMGLLVRVTSQSGMGGDPEPRVIGQIGKSTLESVFNIGIYANKEIIGSGYGETVEIGVKTAVLNSLSNLFGQASSAIAEIPYQGEITPQLLKSSPNKTVYEWNGQL